MGCCRPSGENASWQGGGSSCVGQREQALVRRFFEAQAKGDLDALKEMMAPDFVDIICFPAKPRARRLLAVGRRG